MRTALIFATLLTACASASGAEGRTYYIDPTGGTSRGSGTMERPWTSWEHVRVREGNTYLQRRGTTVTTDRQITIGAADVTLGAYGKGERPKIVSRVKDRGQRHAIAINGGRNATIRDLDIEAPAGTSCIRFGKCTNARVENCVVHGAMWGIRAVIGPFEGLTILNTEVHTIGDDGMFIQNVSKIEIAHCHVHHVNCKWKPPYTPQGKAGGDGIQFSKCDDWHVHHNTIDRTNSGNKFCFISNDDVQKKGVFEHNTCSGPLTSGDGGSCVYFSDGTDLVVRYNTFNAPAPGAIYHHAKRVKVYGNIINGIGGVTAYTKSPCWVYNNVFYDCKACVRGENLIVKNNVFVLASGGKAIAKLGQLEQANNITANAGEPLFVNAEEGDFRPRPGSRLLNAGVTVELAADPDGVPIPQFGAPDVGAYEFPSREYLASKEEENAPAKTAAAAKPHKKKTSPEAIQLYDAHLMNAVLDCVAAEKHPTFFLSRRRAQAMVRGIDIDGKLSIVLTRTALELQIDWSRLTNVEKRNLAAATIDNGSELKHEITAFFALAAGDEREAQKHLALAGEGAQRVLDMFF